MKNKSISKRYRILFLFIVTSIVISFVLYLLIGVVDKYFPPTTLVDELMRKSHWTFNLLGVYILAMVTYTLFRFIKTTDLEARKGFQYSLIYSTILAILYIYLWLFDK